MRDRPAARFPGVLRRPAAALLGLLTLAAATLVAEPAGAHPGAPAHGNSGRYVALGDSYASGEGLPPFEPGTETADGCHRSADQSYPVLLAASGRRAFSRLESVACSGAGTLDLVTSTGSQPPQLSALRGRTRTVTLTIGGNDAGFGVIFADCVYSPNPDLGAALPGRPGCQQRNDAAVSARIAALAGRPGAPTVPGIVPLPDVLAEIDAVAPRATVYLTGYPSVFGTRTTDAFGCRVNAALPLYVAAGDARWIRNKAADLNAAIRSAAVRARRAGIDVHYVDAARAFRGHNLCDKKSPWLNGVVLASVNPPQLSTATFHPTARGQQAYASAVLHAATGKWARTTASPGVSLS
jgi:lysophospholipase L1-like esterase